MQWKIEKENFVLSNLFLLEKLKVMLDHCKKMGNYNVEKYHQVLLLVFKNPSRLKETATETSQENFKKLF